MHERFARGLKCEAPMRVHMQIKYDEFVWLYIYGPNCLRGIHKIDRSDYWVKSYSINFLGKPLAEQKPTERQHLMRYARHIGTLIRVIGMEIDPSQTKNVGVVDWKKNTTIIEYMEQCLTNKWKWLYFIEISLAHVAYRQQHQTQNMFFFLIWWIELWPWSTLNVSLRNVMSGRILFFIRKKNKSKKKTTYLECFTSENRECSEGNQKQ